MYLENSWWNVFSNRLGVGGLWVMLVTWSTTQYSFNKLASRWPVSLNLIAFVSTLQKATQMRFFMDKLIVNGYLLNWIFFYIRYTIFSPKDGQPCMDHDRQTGEVGVMHMISSLWIEQCYCISVFTFSSLYLSCTYMHQFEVCQY